MQIFAHEYDIHIYTYILNMLCIRTHGLNSYVSCTTGAGALAEALPHAAALQHLTLARNNLYAEGITALSKFLPACSVLTVYFESRRRGCDMSHINESCLTCDRVVNSFE